MGLVSFKLDEMVTIKCASTEVGDALMVESRRWSQQQRMLPEEPENVFSDFLFFLVLKPLNLSCSVVLKSLHEFFVRELPLVPAV